MNGKMVLFILMIIAGVLGLLLLPKFYELWDAIVAPFREALWVTYVRPL